MSRTSWLIRRRAARSALVVAGLLLAWSGASAADKAPIRGGKAVREIRRFENSNDDIASLAFTKDGRTLAATTWNVNAQIGRVFVFSVETGKQEKSTFSYTGFSAPMARFADDGGRLYFIDQAADRLPSLNTFHIKTGRSTPVLNFATVKPARPPHIGRWLLSADGSTAIFSHTPVPNSQLPGRGATDANPTLGVSVWDLKKKRELHFAIEEAQEVNALALSSDGTIAAVALRSYREETLKFKENLRVWDIRTKEVLYSAKLDKITQTVPAIAFADGDKKLAVVSPHWGQFDVIDVVAGKRTTVSTKGWEGDNGSTLFVPGTTLALSGMFYGGKERGFRLTDWEKGEIVDQVEGDDIISEVRAATPDGKRIATGGTFKPVIVWDLKGP